MMVRLPYLGTFVMRLVFGVMDSASLTTGFRVFRGQVSSLSPLDRQKHG